jgi:fermentation-respiration switch protein FrsA (DUF1100 family)
MLTDTPSTTVSDSPFWGRLIRSGRGWCILMVVLLTLSAILTSSYTAFSIYIATQIMNVQHLPIYATPASLELQYKDVTFPSLEDHLRIRGWFIPGVLPNGHLTSQRTIIIVHGNTTNRADKGAGILNLSGDLARRGFAILAFDMRGAGESPPAPRSFGLYEQRDILGAVDFLQSGQLPYPALGRPRAIAGWGVSMGGATLIMAAAKEPAIRAIVSDCAYADILPIIEREIPKNGHIPALFTPGALIASQALYGVDYYNTRPVDSIASIAPRPIFLIHGANDTYIPPSNMYTLAAAAVTAPHANVQTWMVPEAEHAQSYHKEGEVYVDRVVAFYTVALGTDTTIS